MTNIRKNVEFICRSYEYAYIYYTKNEFYELYDSLGVSVRDKAVAGVLHQPFAPSEKEGRTIWALVGFGVYGLETETSL